MALVRSSSTQESHSSSSSSTYSATNPSGLFHQTQQDEKSGDSMSSSSDSSECDEPDRIIVSSLSNLFEELNSSLMFQNIFTVYQLNQEQHQQTLEQAQTVDASFGAETTKQNNSVTSITILPRTTSTNSGSDNEICLVQEESIVEITTICNVVIGEQNENYDSQVIISNEKVESNTNDVPQTKENEKDECPRVEAVDSYHTKQKEEAIKVEILTEEAEEAPERDACCIRDAKQSVVSNNDNTIEQNTNNNRYSTSNQCKQKNNKDTSKNKKRRPSRSERMELKSIDNSNSKRNIRRVDPAEFGFNLSGIPRLSTWIDNNNNIEEEEKKEEVEQSKSSDAEITDQNILCEGETAQVTQNLMKQEQQQEVDQQQQQQQQQQPNTNHESDDCKEILNINCTDNIDSSSHVENVCNNDHDNSDNINDDDEEYFASIGIDVNDCGRFESEDSFLNWDDHKFYPARKSKSKASSLNSNFIAKSSSSSSNKSSKSQNYISTKSSAVTKNANKTQHTAAQLYLYSEIVSPETTTTLSSDFMNLSIIDNNCHHYNSNYNYKNNLLPIVNCNLNTNQRILFSNLESSPSSSSSKHRSCSSSIRKDKHRKIEKLHRAIKTPHCTLKNITNTTKNGDRVYMHHRLIKKTGLDLNGELDFRNSRRSGIPSMPKIGVDLSVAKAIRLRKQRYENNNNGNNKSRSKPAPAQNLHHVLHESNVPTDVETDLANFLLSLQTRDLTPEDYEMLLRLDESVKAKTVSKSVLDDLKTETVGASDMTETDDIVMCVICMEPYQVGQTRKFLPCGHDFHSTCIDSWLQNSSQNCPLDGLPIANDS